MDYHNMFAFVDDYLWNFHNSFAFVENYLWIIICFVFVDDYLWIIIIWWLSQLWISRHIWFPQSERLAKTER